jgi:hypothetical protein
MKAIPLTKGKVALVDDADFVWLSQYKWHAVQPSRPNGSFYAARRDTCQAGRYVYMHNVLLGVVGVDHRDGDGLNNQRDNLRSATAHQNACSRRLNVHKRGTGFKGVTRASAASRMSPLWLAYIEANGKRYYLGYFGSPIEAARAYDSKALELHGEFALTNRAMGLL